MFAVLVVGLLLTLAVAIIGWFRPVAPKLPAAPTYSAQQVADAKKKVCSTFTKVDNAVRAASARNKGDDYATQFATAINVRQALVVGSQYLSTTLNQEPATSTELASSVRDLVNSYQLLTIELLSDAPELEKDPTVHAGDEANSKIENQCK
ncbi:hypothetical protein [Mycobacterium shigaense]|uniref:Uncharacterized protein n=1 Tax=Mycobacterium shigaense TaxID=722731 RepID=A0A1Z4EJG7_9MYCO|nr:hypothetical protein [Mycobacterium shigaense]BAX93101.1 hypothetical protein MSG_02960 [Mycobacterium shigaense]